MDKVTLHQLFSGVIYTGTIMGALTAIGVFIHFALVKPIRRFLRNEIVAELRDLNSGFTRLEGLMTEHVSDPAAHISKAQK